MAEKKSTSRIHRRTALFLCLFSVSAILFFADAANAQRQNRSSTTISDRLFEPEFYSQLKSNGEVEGRLIGPQYAGQKLSREPVLAIVLERFIKAAADQGIPEKDITKAIFAGHFNLDFEDLELAWGGVDIYDTNRDEMWNKRFGAIGNIGEVRTIINGQEVTRSGKDILLRVYMHKNFSEFPKYYRRNPDANLTYDQMVARFREEYPDSSQYQYEVKSLENTLKFRVGHISAYSYFKLVAKDCCPTFHLRKDYEDLRSKLYIPSIQKALAKTNTPPSTTVRPGFVRQAPSTPSTTKKTTTQPKIPVKATCDGLAAHPEDKGSTGAGVADEKIVSGPAIEKCSQAVRQSPNVARLHFQLGRAYWAAKRYDEALDAFLKAEEMEYAPAYFYLGQAYEQGLIEGEKADPAAARNLYMIAASEGFEPAVRAYQESMGDEPDFSEFKQPDLLQALYEGNLEGLNRARRETLLYIGGIQQFLDMPQDAFPPNEYDPTCQPQNDPALRDLMRKIALVELFGLHPDSSSVDIYMFIRRRATNRMYVSILQDWEKIVQDGVNDFYLFTYDYGSCEGEAARKVYATIKRFVMENSARLPK